MLFLKGLISDFAGLLTLGACMILAFYTFMASMALLATIIADKLTFRDKVLYGVGLGVIAVWGGYLVQWTWHWAIWLLT